MTFWVTVLCGCVHSAFPPVPSSRPGCVVCTLVAQSHQVCARVWRWGILSRTEFALPYRSAGLGHGHPSPVSPFLKSPLLPESNQIHGPPCCFSPKGQTHWSICLARPAPDLLLPPPPSRSQGARGCPGYQVAVPAPQDTGKASAPRCVTCRGPTQEDTFLGDSGSPGSRVSGTRRRAVQGLRLTCPA